MKYNFVAPLIVYRMYSNPPPPYTTKISKTIKEPMMTGIAPKSCIALFPLWSKMRKIQRENVESAERNLNI